MAADSNRFPLHNAIKKILDDPNSRPKLPGLDEGSVVGDDTFGKADRYDTGKWSDIALNNGNVVVEVHNTTDSKSLYYRVGKVDGGKINWGESRYYDKGVEPSVAITDNGLVIEVHKSQGLKHTLWYRVGNVEGNEIKWRNDDKSAEYDSGVHPSVAITNSGLVVEVHQSQSHDTLWYGVGKVEGNEIKWENNRESIEYEKGIHPSVAITNDGLVVEVHQSPNPSGAPLEDASPPNTLWYRVGRVESNGLIWVEGDQSKSTQYDSGAYPSVALTNDGLVVEVHQSQSYNTLWYRGTGQVNNNTIDGWDDKKDSQNFGDGTTPRVACNGQLAVETHSGADNQLLSSVLTLPAFRGKWTLLEGDNSYCYCACKSATDNKDRHVSSHTMNVKAGAPYFYAVLTKDDDSIDFPTGAVLTIEGPDGTKYDRDIQDENQLVIMSGSSVRCLIVKEPKPGGWKMTMTVPEGVGFHCECNTVPSKDVYNTITTTLSKTNQFPKRDLSEDEHGWAGPAAGVAIAAAGVTAATETLEISVAFSIAGTTLALTPLGVFFLAAAVGIAAVTFLSSVASVKTPSEPSKQVSKITTDLTNAAQTISTTPPPTPQPVATQDALKVYLSSEENKQANDGLGDFEILLQDDETPSTYHSYLDWINAIRTQSGAAVAVRLNINNTRSPWIRIGQRDFYVTAFSDAENPWANDAWHNIPDGLINYGTNSVNISSQSIQTAMGRVRRWLENSGTGLDHGALTLLIFVSAEAARFDSVAFAVNALLRGQVTNYDWLNFRPLLTNWGFISENIYRRRLQPGVSLFVSRALAGSRRGNQSLFGYLNHLAEGLGYPLGYNPTGRSS